MDATPAPDFHKQPTVMHVNHSDMPELGEVKLGDRVHLHLHGIVKAIRSKDKYGDGTTEVEVHHIHPGDPDQDIEPGEGNQPTSEEAKEMPLHELRKKLPHKESY